MKAIEKVIDEFLTEPSCQKKLIVNLGCGYDPLPFAYLSETSNVIFVDIDYPDLIRHKCSIIRETPALAELIGPNFGETSGEIRTEKYNAIGCDLSNLTLFNQALSTIEPNLHTVSILFISEVAITYMVPLPY
jgi:tRNA wybutosine-synthesizing protein 4